MHPSHTYRIRAEADGVLEIDVYDAIGGDLFSEGVTAREVRATLRAAEGIEKIKLRVNSRGGDVFDGIAIYNLLREHPAHVEAHVDALAASMASVILMAADEVIVAKGAMIMIHNPVAMAVGDAADMRSSADLLDKMRDQLVAAYVEKTGLDRDEVIALMDAETWLDAEEAVERGFADRVKAAPRRRERTEALARLALDGLEHAPRGLIAAVARAGARRARAEVRSMSDEEIAELRSALGLAEDADGAAILAAVRALAETAEDDEPEEDEPREEDEGMQARLRVLESQLAAAQDRLRAHDEARLAAARAEAEASIDAAIRAGHVVADVRDDLLRLALSEREDDRATCARLLGARTSAPKGRVTREPATSAEASLTGEEHTVLRHMIAAGVSRERAMQRIERRRGRAMMEE